jgi:hypothetical protein
MNRASTTSFLLTLLCALLSHHSKIVLVAGAGAVRIDVADKKAMARLRRRLPYDEEKENEEKEGKFVRRCYHDVHVNARVEWTQVLTCRCYCGYCS